MNPKNLNPRKGTVQRPIIGRMVFPVVTTLGFIREIEVSPRETGQLSPPELGLLDKVGSAVFGILRKRTGLFLTWNPADYYFRILDPFGAEDVSVKGESMGLPLALALYSHVTGTAVPAHLSATGALGRDGSIGPVEYIEEKLITLGRERFSITHVLVAESQTGLPSFRVPKMLPVQTLEQAFEMAFPQKPQVECLSAPIDIDLETKKIKGQYHSYLIDTCIQNAELLTNYLEGRFCRLSADRRIPALFTCYWRLGSCHCHKGETRKTAAYLKKAKKLYSKNKNFIRPTDFYGSQLNYTELLKDLFKYDEAEALHKEIEDGLEIQGCLSYEKGKNLSSLSLVHLAQHGFEKAITLQKKAIKLIPEWDRCRNCGLLAQIFTRAGRFADAGSALRDAKACLNKVPPDKKAGAVQFYDWIRSEFLCRKGVAQKRSRQKAFGELHNLADSYLDVTNYPHALIQKFSGLALLIEGDEESGMRAMAKAVTYLEAYANPVYRLLGATVRLGRALYLTNAGRYSEALGDLLVIKESLSLQKDIRNFFKVEIKALGSLLRKKAVSTKDEKDAINIMENLCRKIPY